MKHLYLKLGLLFLLASCASRGSETEVELGYESATIEMGLLHFTDSGSKGFLLSGVDWTKPVSEQNPALECENKPKRKGSFVCKVSESGSNVRISVLTKKIKTEEFIAEITLEGRGLDLFDLWLRELVANGFFQDRQRREPGRRQALLIGPDQGTLATMTYEGSNDSVKLVLKN